MSGKRLIGFLLTAICIVGIGHAVQGTSPHFQASPAFDISVPHAATLPSEALRLRIIANSDSQADQTLKLEIRDAVVVETGKLLQGVHTSVEARQVVMQAVPRLRALAEHVEHLHGYHYAISTEVGKVPFPTKIYGNHVYPAGNYQALRLVIGAGQGQNWWCVLFPPLCFVDIADGDAIPNTGAFPDLPPIETIQVTSASGRKVKVAVRLAAVDYGEILWKRLSRLF